MNNKKQVAFCSPLDKYLSFVFMQKGNFLSVILNNVERTEVATVYLFKGQYVHFPRGTWLEKEENKQHF